MATWNTDAQFAETLNTDYLHANARIANFLSSHSYTQFIVVASKGMGKTLLLRHKRKAIQNDEPGFVLIPKDETADYVTLPASPTKGLVCLFRDSVFWEDLWKISIAISALLHFPHKQVDKQLSMTLKDLERVYLPSPLQQELANALTGSQRNERRPSSVLNILLQSGHSALERTRASAVQVLWDAYNRHITSGCFVFIDSFDQALNKLFPDDLQVWCSAQTGLMKAAWEMSRHNRHSKVYTTIRQEAFASAFCDAERANLKGNVLLIEYNRADLKAILLNAVRCYENLASIEELVGFTKIYNSYLRLHEPVFDYIHRHTTGVPRWLITIGAELASSREGRGLAEDALQRKLLQKQTVEIVNRIASEELAYGFLKGEMRLFFKGEDPEEFVDHLLSKINSSVLSYSNLKRISEKFVKEHARTGNAHPFCLLYNLGLIGIVHSAQIPEGRKQLFKKPYQFDWNFENVLPIDPEGYYLLHPSLHHLIQKKNYRFNFNKVRIGADLPWGKREERRLRSEKVKIFISYAHEDGGLVDEIVDIMEEYLNVKAILHDIWLDKWKMRAGRWVPKRTVSRRAASLGVVGLPAIESRFAPELGKREPGPLRRTIHSESTWRLAAAASPPPVLVCIDALDAQFHTESIVQVPGKLQFPAPGTTRRAGTRPQVRAAFEPETRPRS